MSQDETHNEVHFHYGKDPMYRIVHATGAQGSITPGGLVNFDLYTERGLAPDSETFALSPEGKMGEKLGDSSESGIHVSRDRQVGVVMSPKDAERLGSWLIKRAQEALKLTETVQEKSAEEA